MRGAGGPTTELLPLRKRRFRGDILSCAAAAAFSSRTGPTAPLDPDGDALTREPFRATGLAGDPELVTTGPLGGAGGEGSSVMRTCP